jgi:glycosyltransferase involved in cell wall biosynthesis
MGRAAGLTDRKAGISVVIPVYNCERYLGEAIESVLCQTCRPTEVFVIDDGSTDGTAGVAQSYAPLVHYVFQPNSGAASARNGGAELAREAFLSFLDSDDLWVEDKLSRQMACFEEDPQLDMVSGYAEHFISPDVAEELAAKVHCPKQPMPAPGPATMLIRRQAFFKVGLFDTRYLRGEAITWFAKAMDLGLRSRMMSDVVLRRRLHLNNISRVSHDVRDDYLRAVRDALERRRQHEADRSFVGTDPGAES